MMFRFTMYSIVAYAFWLTFVDVSTYLEQETDNSWLTNIKQEWASFKQDQQPVDVSSISVQYDDCEARNSCNDQSVPVGE